MKILRYGVSFLLLLLISNSVFAQEQKKLTYAFEAELHYNDALQRADQNSSNFGKLDLHKASFKTGYSFNKKWSIGSKVIVEHAFDKKYEGGDVYFTNFYAKYKINKKFNIQAGLISVPLCGGKSSTYGTVEVSPVEKYMSIAWREVGVSFSGTPSKQVSYKAMVSTGLNPAELNSKTVVYNARNADLGSSLNNIGAGGHLKIKPNYEWTIGTAFFYSGLSNSDQTEVDLSGADYRIAEFYTQYAFGKFESRIVGVYSSIRESDKINEAFHSKIGSAQYGTLLEFGYDLSDLFPINIEESSVKGFARVESYDAHFRTDGTSDKRYYEHTDYSLGIVYQPVKALEVKADYVLLKTGDNALQQLFDFSLGYHF